MLSDGLGCFAGESDAGCAHSYIVVGKRKPREPAAFGRVNTVPDNLETMISGGCKAFDFGKYAGHHYLGAFSWRFNGRFDLRGMFRLLCLWVASAEPARNG